VFLATPSITWPSSRFCTSSWRCSARLSSRTVRRDTTMLPRRRSIFRIWNGCGTPMSGPTSRTGRMSTCERGRHVAPSGAEDFVEGDPPFGLCADVDDRDILLDRDHQSLDDRSFLDLGAS